ncbi:MAG: hypothetical protein L6V81_10915 [Clostridium sp.]|nr:MAG: hypothetical protein L6V81_10915 [Clostridium sp.]
MKESEYKGIRLASRGEEELEKFYSFVEDKKRIKTLTYYKYFYKNI